MKRKNKLSRKELKKKSEDIIQLVRGVVEDNINIPNDSVIFDVESLIEVFTKKRLELLFKISKFKPKSINELAELTNRKKQSVDRDLKILEKQELIKLKKVGKNVIPLLERKFLVIGLGEIYPLEYPNNEEATAQVYVNKKNVNEVIAK